MAIDFSFPEETQHLIAKVREFCSEVVKPAEARIDAAPDDRDTLVSEIITMRKAAKEAGCERK